MFSQVRNLYKKHERHAMSAALVAGFVLDNLTLQRIDLLFENIVLSSYLIAALLGIFCMHVLPVRGAVSRWLVRYAPIVTQFAFGGLFSGFFVFYSRSADFSSSWPFLLVLLGVLVGNEVFKEERTRFILQISVFFLGLLSYSIFLVPIIMGTISAGIFLISVAVSLVVIVLVLAGIRRLAPLIFSEARYQLRVSIAGITTLVIVLYFTNIIPPIPLALKDAGIYHSVVRRGGDYALEKEVHAWYAYLIPGETLHVMSGDTLSIWSSVFAPTNLTTEIVHLWQYKDPETGKWEERARVPFEIVGGRDEGYRGFSTKGALTEGKWRVRVETARGQVIGTKTFHVQFSDEEPETEMIVR